MFLRAIRGQKIGLASPPFAPRAATSPIPSSPSSAVSPPSPRSAPNPAAPPLPVDDPFVLRDGRLVPHEPACARWQPALPLTMLDAHLANIRRLRTIAFDVGPNDHFRHFPVSVRALNQELTARGIAPTFTKFAGGHTDRAQERLVKHALPFLARHLLFTPAKN